MAATHGASMMDSGPVFKEWAFAIGINEDEMAVMEKMQWATFAKIAFACGYQPGNSDESLFIKFAAKITGSGAEEPPEERVPIIRRLFYEAYTMASSDMRARVERRGDEAPRTLALAERRVRNTE